MPGRELNTGRSDHWRTLYPLDQWAGLKLPINNYYYHYYCLTKNIIAWKTRNHMTVSQQLIIILLTHCDFFSSAFAGSFHWSLSDITSPQVYRTLLSILVDLNNTAGWRVSARPLMYQASSPISNPVGTVSNAPITVGITVIFMFYNIFSSLTKSKCLSLFFGFFDFHTVIHRDGKINYMAGSFILLPIPRFRRPAEIRWSVCISKSQSILCDSFSRTDSI